MTPSDIATHQAVKPAPDKCPLCVELAEARERIKRLEEALAWYEYTVENCYCHGSEGDAARDALRKDQGRKAKEAKP
jgi:hypothetical protein